MKQEKYRSLASPVKFHDTDDGPKGPAPKLGEHNSEILSDIGFTKEEIQGMIKEGIIGKEV